MSQELEIGIVNGDRLLGCISYRWSGYTESALEETLNIVDAIEEISSKESKLLNKKGLATFACSNIENDSYRNNLFELLDTIHVLEATGSGLECRDFRWLQTNYPEYSGSVRVAVSPKLGFGSITIIPEKLQEYNIEDMGVIIDIKKETVKFGVIFIFNNEEWYDFKDDVEEAQDLLDNAININFKNEMSFEEFREFASVVQEDLSNDCNGTFITRDEKGEKDLILYLLD